MSVPPQPVDIRNLADREFVLEVMKTDSTLTWWIYGVVIIGAALMASGGVIALVKPEMLVAPTAQITDAVRVYAGYLVARNLTIAAMLLLALGLRAQRALGTLMLLTAFVQLFDAGLDCVEGRWTLVPGVAILAIAFFSAAAHVSGAPFWKIGGWREQDESDARSQRV